MAIIDTYKRNLENKKDQKLKLQKERLSEMDKINKETKKILDAEEYIQRSTSESSNKSKERTIQSSEKNISGLNKNIAKLDDKIYRLDKDIVTEEKNILREEERMERQKR